MEIPAKMHAVIKRSQSFLEATLNYAGVKLYTDTQQKSHFNLINTSINMSTEIIKLILMWYIETDTAVLPPSLQGELFTSVSVPLKVPGWVVNLPTAHVPPAVLLPLHTIAAWNSRVEMQVVGTMKMGNKNEGHRKLTGKGGEEREGVNCIGGDSTEVVSCLHTVRAHSTISLISLHATVSPPAYVSNLR